jgi:hypothetical protein
MIKRTPELKLMRSAPAIHATKLAWHYTVWHERAERILAEGVIKPATQYVPTGEVPVVWFSGHPRWERTANKTMVDSKGKSRALSMEETIELGGGAYRFGLPRDQLLPWNKLRTAIRMTSQWARGLTDAGRAVGADPKQWYGSLAPVPIFGLCIAETLRDNHWVSLASLLSRDDGREQMVSSADQCVAVRAL